MTGMDEQGVTQDAHTDAPESLEGLRARYNAVRERIAQSALSAGRDPESILLVAVTKTAEPDQIRELIRLGHADFAENRLQQLVQRASMIDEWLARHRRLPGSGWSRSGPLQDPRDTRDARSDAGQGGASGEGSSPAEQVRWHMIGHLQRNKARKVVELCRLVHSVDSLRLAEELQQIGMRKDREIEVLLQVNCSGEPQKYGCAVPAAMHLAEQIDTMVCVRIRGLMTMAPYSENAEDSRATFRRCAELFHEIKQTGVGDGRFNILSMGMSNDYTVAIEEGANIVRVGSAIFGDGNPEDDHAPEE